MNCTTRKRTQRFNQFLSAYIISMLIDVVLTTGCPGTFTDQGFANKNSCDEKNLDINCIERGQSQTIEAGGFYGSTIDKWTFYSTDPLDVLSITFNEFNLSGPECGNSNNNFATVTLASTSQVQLPRFCAGRPPAKNSIYSGGSTLSVTLCNGNIGTKMLFTVKAERNWRAITSTQNQIIKIDDFRNGDTNWIYITEPSGRYDVNISLNNFYIKQSKTEKCTRAFVRIDDSSGESLLTTERKILCNTTGLKWSRPVEVLASINAAGGINITHRNAKFVLTFKAIDKTTNMGNQPRALDPPTTVTGNPKLTDFPDVGQVEDNDDTAAANPTMIIIVVVSVSFIAAVICGVVCFVRKRNSKGKKNKCDVNKNPNCSQMRQNFDSYKTCSDEAAMNNLMYESVLNTMQVERAACDMHPHTSQERPLTNVPSFTQGYAKVKKSKPEKPTDTSIRPPQPLPRSNHPSATPNMYETIETATQSESILIPPCSTYMGAHSTPFHESNGSGYLESSLHGSAKFSASPKSPSISSTSSDAIMMNEYNKPRPSIPNLFISTAYCSSAQLSNGDSSFNLQYNLDETSEITANTLHEGQFPATYYDSPRPSLANTFVPNNSFTDTNSLS